MGQNPSAASRGFSDRFSWSASLRRRTDGIRSELTCCPFKFLRHHRSLPKFVSARRTSTAGRLTQTLRPLDIGGLSEPESDVFEGLVPDLLVIAVLGYEVEDLALAERQMEEFWDAAGYAVAFLWDNIISPIVTGAAEIPPETLSEVLEDIGESGIWDVVFAVGIFVATIVVTFIWAGISVPDTIIKDFIILPRAHFYFLTHPSNPHPPQLPPVSFGSGEDRVTVSVPEVVKLANDLIETRRYRNREEDSTYRLKIRYSRI